MKYLLNETLNFEGGYLNVKLDLEFNLIHSIVRVQMPHEGFIVKVLINSNDPETIKVFNEE